MKMRCLICLSRSKACVIFHRLLKGFLLILFWNFLLPLPQVSYGQNIGIGTTSPSQKLDVAGNIKLGDNIMVEGNQTNMKIYRNLVSYASNTGTGAFAIHTNQPLDNAQWAMVVEG